MTVKSCWVGFYTYICVPIFFADGFGFAVAVSAKLELEVQFVNKVTYPIPKLQIKQDVTEKWNNKPFW